MIGLRWNEASMPDGMARPATTDGQVMRRLSDIAEVVIRGRSTGAATRSVAAAAFAGLAALLGSTAVAEQDAGPALTFKDQARWSVSVAQGSHGESRSVAHTGPAGSPEPGSFAVEGVDPVVTGTVDPTLFVPDEERIDRTWKSDLPATITTPATAPGFSAGSIYPEHSRLAPPNGDSWPPVAFAATNLPLSSLAVARFIRPQPASTEVAELQPIPTPKPRPDVTLLVAANYPERPLAPEDNGAAQAMLAAYAPDQSAVDQGMFAALFAVPREKPAAPPEPTGKGDHWWARLLLPSQIYSAREQRCLAEAVYFEARSEPYKGQVAVAQVVLNRVRNPAYPETVCKVVYQNKGARNACQFSFACDGVKDVVRDRKAWALARKVAQDVSFKGVRLEKIGTSTHYHATYVRPAWASVFTRKDRIGKHVFYQTIHGGWS
jgi:spore germination cell wall hydrolase CwlJ-like protein